MYKLLKIVFFSQNRHGWSYNQNRKAKELQEEMLQVLGGLSTMQYYYCFKGMENMFGI